MLGDIISVHCFRWGIGIAGEISLFWEVQAKVLGCEESWNLQVTFKLIHKHIYIYVYVKIEINQIEKLSICEFKWRAHRCSLY